MSAMSARIRFGAAPSAIRPDVWAGDSISISIDFFNPDTGTAVDASGVTAIVINPAGEQVLPAPTPSRVAVGLWKLDITVIAPGDWQVAITATNPSLAVDRRGFRVLDAQPTSPAPTPVPPAPSLSAYFSDLIEATIAPAVPLTRDPLTTDDVDAGFRVFSLVLNTNNGRVWLCVDATADAAAWRPLSVAGGFVHRSGLYYPMVPSGQQTTIRVTDPDLLFLTPFELHERVPFAALGFWIVTGGTGSAVKQAIWRDVGGRPAGAPLLADNAGVATATSSAAALAAVTGFVGPGLFWHGAKHSGAVLPIATVYSSQDVAVLRRVGRPSLNSANTVTALSLASPYADAMPTLTGAESFGYQLTGGVCLPYYQVA
jgi:hypothetical protein